MATELLRRLAVTLAAAALLRGAHAADAQPPLTGTSWDLLQHSAWVAEGAASTSRVIYVLVDPNCPYCHALWLKLQTRYARGVQVRFVMLDIISATSPGKAAAVLEARDPARAWRRNETGWNAAAGDVDGGAIKPDPAPPPAIRDKLDKNERLMSQLPFAGIPEIFYRDRAGPVHMLAGVPDDARLDAVLDTAGGR
ncbi:MAG TPA: thiol:disulfide interchange protein DsbG [Gammaproteobacteria bacterium]|nr:thiol:disulfide interchange protein DsbG [Gammaproteobacteria bacterium]